LNPVFTQWWTKPKSVNPPSLHHQPCQSLRISLPSATLHHLLNIHRFHHDPHADPAPTTIDLLQGDETSDLSQSIEVLVVGAKPDVPGDHRGLAPLPETCPLTDRNTDNRIGRDQSLFDRPPHISEKYATPPRNFLNNQNTPPQSQLFKLQLGGPINKPPPILILTIDLLPRTII
jgi:hypothetical protein